MSIFNILIFYITAFIIIFAALGIVFCKRIQHSLIFAISFFFSISILFFALNTPLNAVFQISIYVVSVSIIIAFSIMLTNNEQEHNLYLNFNPIIFSGILSLFVFLIICFLYFNSNNIFNNIFNTQNKSIGIDTANIISYEIMSKYPLIVELIALILTCAIIGIVSLFYIKENKRSSRYNNKNNFNIINNFILYLRKNILKLRKKQKNMICKQLKKRG